MAKSALLRKESRGAHSRIDFPSEQDEWLEYNVVVSKDNDGSMSTKKVKREKPDEELVRIANLTIEELESEVASERRK